MNFQKKLLLLVPASALFLTACLEEEQISLVQINSNNAAEVIDAALDAKDAISHAKDSTDAIVGSGTLNGYTINCDDALINATTDPAVDYGTVTVAGSWDSPAGSSNVVLTYNNCLVQSSRLNGSMTMIYSETANVKTGSFSGDLDVEVSSNSGTLSLGLKNVVYDYTRDRTALPAEPFTEDFGLDLTLPLLGTLNVDTPTPFSGDKNVSSKPDTGTMVVSAGGGTKARLTAIDNTSYSVSADTSGDGVYDTDLGTYAW